jgi:hypothetical protein
MDQRFQHELGVLGVGFGAAQAGQPAQLLGIHQVDFAGQVPQPGADRRGLAGGFQRHDPGAGQVGEQRGEFLASGMQPAGDHLPARRS